MVDRRARRGADGQEPEHEGCPRRAHTPGRPEDRAHRHPGREPVERAVGDSRRGQSWSVGRSAEVPRAIRDPDRTVRRRRRGSTSAAHHPAVHPASHQGRQASAAGSARQDRADRVRQAHQGAGDAVPAGRRPTPRGCRSGTGHEATRPRARRAHAPQADLQSPRPRPQRQFTSRRTFREADPVRRAGHRHPRPG